MTAALEQQRTISEEDHAKVRFMTGIVHPMRSFLFTTPDDQRMTDWRTLTIPSADGIPLEAWYIPAAGGESDRLVVFNHALPMCRAGFPGHFGEPWSAYDDGEIDFVLQYKHLTDAGYNVLTYDLRNHGNSGAANGGVCGMGEWEWRDCVGVKEYVDRHPRLSGMKVALYSQCLGANSQYKAIHERPNLFANVTCMVSPMVVSLSAIIDASTEGMGIGRYQELVDLELMKAGAFVAAEMTPQRYAPSVTMPVLMVQLYEDTFTRNPQDAQTTFDLLGSAEKDLHWIRGTNRRFKDGYNYFGRYPERILPFIDKHME